MTASPTVTPWPNFEPPSHEQVEATFREEDLSPSWWSNAPGEVYAGHSHPYHKVLYCAQGSIQFAIEPSISHPETGSTYRPGSRIPPSSGRTASHAWRRRGPSTQRSDHT